MIRPRRCYILKLVSIVISILFLLSHWLNYHPSKDHKFNENFASKYAIETSKCKIPSLDPFGVDVLEYYHHKEYIPCSSNEPLTYIDKNNDERSTLNVNKSVLWTYSFLKINCCFSIVTRIKKFNEPEHEIHFSECRYFEDSVVITDQFIFVECESLLGLNVYSNVHVNFELQPNKIINSHEDDGLNVILVGIDSVSKLNLLRTMPKTYSYMKNHEDFVELEGYTKIADNTLPNLLAILTGETKEQFFDHCNPYEQYFDNCSLIFERFKQMEYVTAYGEDETAIGTFNHNLKGFYNEPTDFYLRPYFQTADELLTNFWRKQKGMNYCTGHTTTGERMLNLIEDYLRFGRDHRKFGLFWMNSYSHNDINTPSTIDRKFALFLKKIDHHLRGNTIMVVFSDHGFRFGPLRRTYTGWLEERQPFMFIHLPKRFKEVNANKVKNLVINSRRLTTPYDLHQTLEDLLKKQPRKMSKGCPKCQSLFEEIPEDRTCEDASILKHWCLCTGYFYENPLSHISGRLANFLLLQINSLIQSYGKLAENCWIYDLKNIVSVGKSEDSNVTAYIIIIRTLPVALFEATIEQISDENNLRVVGEISRINRYGDHSTCVHDSLLKKYCYCNNVFGVLMKSICTFADCL